ncbi:hypothetical protein BKA93DRAFT_615809 [Sparassis latifolia]
MIILTRARFAKRLALRLSKAKRKVPAKAQPHQHHPESATTRRFVQGVPPDEVIAVTARRMAKAERDERMDITLALTEVKEYMGGFTRPRDLSASRWFRGGTYDRRGTVYESPPEAAYESHTVFIVESRYPVVHGVGRIDTEEQFVGVCREGDLPALLASFNSAKTRGEFREAMDNARWPWMQNHPMPRKTVWWEPGESPDAVHRKAIEESTDFASELQDGKRVPVELLTPASSSYDARSHLKQRRSFHASALARAGDHSSSSSSPSSSFQNRDKSIPASSWSRPPRPPQDADDNVVPAFYVERKRQRDDISERKVAESSLMAELNAGILSEGLSASVRPREEKIPVEVRMADGSVRHPSGFEPPTAETDFHPVAAKTPTEEDPQSILSTVKQMWDARKFAEPEVPPISIDADVEAEYLKRKVQDIIDNSAVRTAQIAEPASAVNFDLVSGVSSTPESPSTTSSWDTPARSTARSTDPDNIVPPYYIERKQQRDSISQRKEEDELMSELSAGVLSDGIAAEMRLRDEKIPVEVFEEDGIVRHPSGYAPPTPETDFYPASAKSPESPPKTLWTELTASKIARGFHWSALVRAQEVPDSFRLVSPVLGTSPPTPSSLHVRDIATTAQGESSDAVSAHDKPPQAEKDGGEYSLISTNPTRPRISYEQLDSRLDAIRRKYRPKLEAEPFWRPLLTVTFATRPLALSFARLARALPRGEPFYASIVPDDRKCWKSFPTRMRQLRLRRARQLTIEMARFLEGYRGGFVGLRFGTSDRGRGIGGEGFAEPIPASKRLIQVGVGEWYKHAADLQELLREEAREADLDNVAVFGLDERGARTDGKAWAPKPRPLPRLESLNEFAAKKGVSFEGMDKWQREEARMEFAKKYAMQIAARRAQGHSSVMHPPPTHGRTLVRRTWQPATPIVS